MKHSVSGKRVKDIAEKIAAKLFTNGAGQRADRLVLTSAEGRNLGGWSERADPPVKPSTKTRKK